MKHIHKVIVILILTVTFMVCQQSTQHADLVFMNGIVITMDEQIGEAEAVAIQKNKIMAVGSYSEMNSIIGGKTRVIDLKGQMVIPGMIEPHGHFMALGETFIELELRYTRSWDEIVSKVAEAVQEVEPDVWIYGRGWHQDKWTKKPDDMVNGLPTHHALSRVSPVNPVLLIHNSGHGSIVNEKLMTVAGIDSNTPNPPNGEVVKDADGVPTGMLRERAQYIARDALAAHLAGRPPEVIEREYRNVVRMAADECVRNGITTFHDLGEPFDRIDFLKRLADEGNLPVRLHVALSDPPSVIEDKMAQYRMVNEGNGFLSVRMIGETGLDGALGTHGGWLLEPYIDKPDFSGYSVIPVDEMRRYAELAMQHDYQLAIQGIGDRAVRELLNIYEEQFNANPDKKDVRWRIEQCQVIHPDDVLRFKDLGVIASVRGVFATSDGLWVSKRLGKQRTEERGYPYGTLAESGAMVINGADPPVEKIDPIANFYAAVTRKMSDGRVFLPEQRMTRMQALKAYTINAAYAGFDENRLGSLTPGKLADITILSKNLLTIPDDEILNTRVTMTVIDGEIVFDRERTPDVIF